MNVPLLLNGKHLSIAVDRSRDTLRLALHCDGRTKEWDDVSLVEVQPGVYSILVEGRSYRAVVDSNGEIRAVAVNGMRISASILDPRQPRRSSGSFLHQGQVRLVASMPGKVVRLLVAEGDAVERNQGLVVVEAMKMQNELKSPKSGVVVQLSVQEGATVATGDLVAVVE